MLPVRVHTIVISVQHDEDICLEEMRDALKEKVIKSVVPCIYLDDDTIYHLQPSGRFVIGGPQVMIGGCDSKYFAREPLWLCNLLFHDRVMLA